MKVLIVEDITLVAERIASLAKRYLDNCKVQIAYTLENAKLYLLEESFDLVFLDLNLNGEDGFGLLKLAAASSFHTIVITANSDQAVRGFDLGILDFLTKPILENRFKIAIERFSNHTSSSRQHLKYLAIKSRGKIDLISIDEVVFIKAAGNYSEIYTGCKHHFLSDKNLDRLLQTLPSHFIRTHRSYIVPKNKINRIINYGAGKYGILLKNNEEIPLSRAVYKQVFKANF